MRSYPRIRKTVKWGGAVVTALVVVVWIGSGWFIHASGFSGGRCVVIAGGGVHVARMAYLEDDDDGKATIAVFERVNRRWEPLPFAWKVSSDYLGPQVFIPLWIPVIAAALIALLASHLDILARRRARLNLCPKCHYDRAGLAAGAVCPECGRPPA